MASPLGSRARQDTRGVPQCLFPLSPGNVLDNHSVFRVVFLDPAEEPGQIPVMVDDLCLVNGDVLPVVTACQSLVVCSKPDMVPSPLVE